MFPIMFYKLFNSNSTIFLFFRSSRPEVFCKKGVLRNFAKFTGKHLCQSLFFDKVAGLRAATLLKKRLWHRCFHVSFVKFLRTLFLTEHLRWLLLFVFKCLFVTSHTLHFTLFTSTSTLFRSSFSVFNFAFRRSFVQKKIKENKKIFIENHKRIWEIVVSTDRCTIKKKD